MRTFKRATKFYLQILLCTGAANVLHAQLVSTLSTLYSFCAAGAPACTDGALPYGALILASDGNFYSTTSSGGANGSGTVFRITGGGSLTKLYDFCAQTNCADGATPYAGLLQANDGNLYGTTYAGGGDSAGTVFKITLGGSLTKLYQFCPPSICADAYGPRAPLIQTASGSLVGTLANGYIPESGGVFALTLGDAESVLANLSCALDGCYHGSAPYSPVVQDSAGNLYGTTTFSWITPGEIYKVDTSGNFTVLYTFCEQTGCPDGSMPYAGLVLASDGNFYGTTYLGGGSNSGTVYRITPAGSLTTLYSFCAQANCADGANPYAGLIQTADGNLYGTTYNGGANGNYGTIFKITTGGQLTTLHSFCAESNCADGSNPYAGLLAADGLFYGTTVNGGPNYHGTVFSLAVTETTALTSSPSGASITVTGTGCAPGTYTTPANLNWNETSICTVAFADPQSIGGQEYQFVSSTVNGGSLSHTNPISVAAGTQSVNAVFAPVQATGPSTAVRFSVSAPTSATAGLPIQFTVSAVDTVGNPVTTYNDPVHFSSSDPAATVPGDAALTNGVGTFGASLVTPGSATLTASDLLFPSLNGTSGSISVTASTSGLSFVPMAPCRLVDTRDSTKPPGFGPPSIAAGSSRSFVLPGGPCTYIPINAQAYSLNVTVVPQGELGYITVWPTGENQPLASTLNSLDGEIKANAAIVPAGTGGAISVFATDGTDVVLDINGYFVSNDSAALGFYPITPCRLVDTRAGAASSLITGTLEAGSTTTLPILSGSCGVPAGATAYSLNFTLVPPGPVAYLTVYPYGQAQPVVSTLNDPTGTVEANAAITPAGEAGSIDVYVTNATDLVVDINGYFAPPGAGALSLYTLPPCRVLDTRNPAGAEPFSGSLNVDVIGSGCGGTGAARAYVFNATVVPDGFLGYLTLWPEGAPQPLASTLNAFNGEITSNMAIVPASNTQVSAYAGGSTYLVLDLFGYFAP